MDSARRATILVVGGALLISGCGSGATRHRATSNAATPVPATQKETRQPAAFSYPPAPRPASTSAGANDLDLLVSSFARSGTVDVGALTAVQRSHDPRVGWLLSDKLRFVAPGADEQRLVAAFRRVSGVDPRRDPDFRSSAWLSITNHLIAWDLASPPRYRALKQRIFTRIDAGWKPFFDDARSAIDWRLVSWGGVPIDARPSGDRKPCPRGCIPALDNPGLTSAARGSWYADLKPVFGVVVGTHAVAFPKNIMEIHEMVNVTIGGRRLGIPYCTLCGSAQAYFTDRVAGQRAPLVLRTSGLLSRSNKVMYDLRTRSVFDTFTGEALSGPLHDRNVTLHQTSVVVSTWGAWKRAHPTTQIVARDGGIGRTYPADPLRGRDANGPIFPIGPADPRLAVQEQIAGVAVRGQRPIAFPVDQATAALADGKPVAVGDVMLVRDGDGVRARLRSGRAVATHQAFWFAWSQFHPNTVVWTPLTR